MLGIDIGLSAIKLVELSRSGQRYRVEATAIEPLPKGAVEDRNPADLDEVSTALKRAIKVSGTRLRQAAVAVPTSSVIIRTIPMPLEFGEEEIEANIQLDASQYIPFPLEEIYLDFQIVAGSAKAGVGTQEVMLVASRQENVELRRDVLQDAGLKPVIVDVEAYALENTFQLVTQQLMKPVEDVEEGAARTAKLTGLVDIGQQITTVYVLRGGQMVFTREQTFGAEQLTTAVAEAYGLPPERAEISKRAGDLPEDYTTTLLEPFQRSLAEQIAQALQFFFSSDQYHMAHQNTLDRLVLMGGGAMTPGVDKVIGDRLEIPTIVGSPFVAMGNASRVNRYQLLRDAPLYAVACGLALRSFD